MFGEFNHAQDLPLTFVMPAVVVEGTFKARIRRVTDLMNDPENAQLVLTDAVFVNIANGRRSAKAAIAKINTAEVLIVHPTVPIEGSGQPRTSKRPIGANILLPPFAVEGKIHLVHERELRTAVMSLTDRWIAVTEARYWGLGIALPPVSVDFVVINHAKAQIAIGNADEWDAPASTEHEAAAANAWSNPW